MDMNEGSFSESVPLVLRISTLNPILYLLLYLRNSPKAEKPLEEYLSSMHETLGLTLSTTKIGGGGTHL